MGGKERGRRRKKSNKPKMTEEVATKTTSLEEWKAALTTDSGGKGRVIREARALLMISIFW